MNRPTTTINNVPLSAEALSLINGLHGHFSSIEETLINNNPWQIKWVLSITMRLNGTEQTLVYERIGMGPYSRVSQVVGSPAMPLVSYGLNTPPPRVVMSSSAMPLLHRKSGATQIPPTPPGQIQVSGYRVMVTPYQQSRLHLARTAQGQPFFCRLVRGNDAVQVARLNSREGPALITLHTASSALALSDTPPSGHLMTIIEHIEDPRDGSHLVVFQASAPSTIFTSLALLLSQHPEGLPERLALSLFVQICSAVMECHAAGVCVRDITPHRIFVFSSGVDGNVHLHAVLADVSQAMVVPAASPFISDRSGTPVYVAPEVLQQPTFNAYAADAWGIGILLHVLLTGTAPWASHASPQQLLALITATEPLEHLLENNPVSAATRALVIALLNRNPEQRLTVVEATAMATTALTSPQSVTNADTMDAADTLANMPAIAAASAAASAEADTDLTEDDPSCGTF